MRQSRGQTERAEVSEVRAVCHWLAEKPDSHSASSQWRSPGFKHVTLISRALPAPSTPAWFRSFMPHAYQALAQLGLAQCSRGSLCSSALFLSGYEERSSANANVRVLRLEVDSFSHGFRSGEVLVPLKQLQAVSFTRTSPPPPKVAARHERQVTPQELATLGHTQALREEGNGQAGFTRRKRSAKLVRGADLASDFLHKFVCKAHLLAQTGKIEHVLLFFSCKTMQAVIRLVLACWSCGLLYINHRDKSATVAEQLACSPPTKAIRVQYPDGSLRIFACEIVPDDAAGRRVLFGISRFPRPINPALLHTRLNHPHRLSRPRYACELVWNEIWLAFSCTKSCAKHNLCRVKTTSGRSRSDSWLRIGGKGGGGGRSQMACHEELRTAQSVVCHDGSWGSWPGSVPGSATIPLTRSTTFLDSCHPRVLRAAEGRWVTFATKIANVPPTNKGTLAAYLRVPTPDCLPPIAPSQTTHYITVEYCSTNSSKLLGNRRNTALSPLAPPFFFPQQISFFLIDAGAAVAERLDPAGPRPDVCKWEIVPDDVAGRRVFSGFSLPPALAFRRCSIVPLIGCHDLDVKSRPNISTQLLSTQQLPGRAGSSDETGIEKMVQCDRNYVTILLGSETELNTCHTKARCTCVEIDRGGVAATYALVHISQTLVERICGAAAALRGHCPHVCTGPKGD
ncbi:hypothetical protein PR048_028805 [Dryococelus australis]|uniref:Uncharacterized protein n=1 Tax=Dryococelus australis TaxID=614101 RepID=A0ABQ9GBK9_9NEOP|nr:hypothetical protein PR048_028805 [Dryococelus australis]